MSKDIRNSMLLALVLICVGLAVWTLMPSSGPKANDLGYVSACPFAPWSSLSLLVVAGAIWAVRKYLMTRAD